MSFLKELLIAVLAVVLVVILLMPMRVALVAASTIPISIFHFLRTVLCFRNRIEYGDTCCFDCDIGNDCR